MLWLGSWIVFIAFWFYTLRLARLDSLSLGIGCAALGTIARFGFPSLGTEGPIYFISFTALLTLIMITIDLYRDKMGLRSPQKSPLDSTESKQ